ncbi:MAG: TonB-dependent receptor [Terriglobia bacterium]|nr:MAG: TonB-dependent receptor [Terriglobia bacterium]
MFVSRVRVPLALLLLAGAGTIGHAQQTTATLLGAITDATGAAVPGVTVQATNLGTNVMRDAQSDASGAFSIPNLAPGNYRVTATKTGFQVARVESVTLQVEQAARLDLQLEVGNITESVNVSASATVLQTENASVGTVIDAAKIVDLPLNGRNFIQLAQLIPGVQAGTPGSITVRRGRGSVGQTDAAYGSTAASANGSRDTANRFYLDGIELMDYDAMTYSFSPSVDSLAEFKVQTSTYSAEYGGAPGGQVNMITKSGANRLHGTLWEFNRNDQLTQSYDSIAGKSVTSPRLNRNQFGANIGGPVWIPRIYQGKDKTFFFFNWESGYAAQGASSAYRTVPTQAQRDGDFRTLVDARTRQPIVLKDPLNIGIANNLLPKSALSPQALAFLAYEPLPNASNGTLNFLTTAASATSRQKNFTGRVDHQLFGKDQISGRYLFNDTYEAGTPIWSHDERNNLGRTQNVAVSWTRVIRPAIVNELRGGWHRFNEAEVFGTSNDAAFDVVGKMGLPLVSRLPEEYGPPTISLNGPDGVYDMYNLQRQIGPRVRSNSIAPFTDTFSLQKGRHFLKFAAEVDRRGVTFGQARAPRGSFNFDGTYTGSAMADFLLGYIRSDSINPAHTNTDLYNYWVALSANDDFKITSRLTLNFGLRWDYFQRYKQKDDRFVNIQLNGFVVGNTVTTKDSPYGRELMAADWNNLGPRFGFAWRPPLAGETVVRGGYGIYYTPQISNAIFAMAEGAQATAGASLTGNIVGAPNLFFNNPFAGAVTSGALNFAVSNDEYMRDSYIQQWNLNVQRKLPGNVVLDVGYVGSKGTKLVVTYEDLNRPIQVVDPRTAGLASLNARRPNQQYQRNVRSDKAIGNSIYHSLQVKAERRLASGLTFLTAYTFSKSISGPSDIGGQVGGGTFIGAPQDVYYMRGDRSVSGFDLTHRFVQTVLYDIPFARGLHGAPKYVLDGWQLSTIMTFQSGFPAAVTSNIDTTGTGINSRPDLVLGERGDLPGDKRTWAHWFNTAAFTQAPFGRFGTSPRTDAVRLPGIEIVDFSVAKAVRFHESKAFEFRTEFFNFLNHFNPDPATVELNSRSATFGAIGGGVQGITTRVIQLGAKLVF